MADDSLDNNLLKWGVKAHYVHSLMCHLVLAANGLKDKVPLARPLYASAAGRLRSVSAAAEPLLAGLV